MPSPWIIEAVDIFKEVYLRFSACAPATPPDQFSFQRFEERLHRSIIIAVAFTAHRHLKSLFAQHFLIIMAAILTAPVGMMNAAEWRLAQIDRHVERTDCQIFLHTVADRPTDDTPRADSLYSQSYRAAVK